MKMCDIDIKLATKIRREKNENCVEFSFHSISGCVQNQHRHIPKLRDTIKPSKFWRESGEG